MIRGNTVMKNIKTKLVALLVVSLVATNVSAEAAAVKPVNVNQGTIKKIITVKKYRKIRITVTNKKAVSIKKTGNKKKGTTIKVKGLRPGLSNVTIKVKYKTKTKRYKFRVRVKKKATRKTNQELKNTATPKLTVATATPSNTPVIAINPTKKPNTGTPTKTPVKATSLPTAKPAASPMTKPTTTPTADTKKYTYDVKLLGVDYYPTPTYIFLFSTNDERFFSDEISFLAYEDVTWDLSSIQYRDFDFTHEGAGMNITANNNVILRLQPREGYKSFKFGLVPSYYDEEYGGYLMVPGSYKNPIWAYTQKTLETCDEHYTAYIQGLIDELCDDSWTDIQKLQTIRDYLRKNGKYLRTNNSGKYSNINGFKLLKDIDDPLMGTCYYYEYLMDLAATMLNIKHETASPESSYMIETQHDFFTGKDVYRNMSYGSGHIYCEVTYDGKKYNFDASPTQSNVTEEGSWEMLDY